MMRFLSVKKGSAVITSLLVMMVLIVLSSSINVFLLRDIRAQRDYLGGMKAFYAAEAGVEQALFSMSVSNFDSSEGEVVNGVTYAAQINRADSSVPCNFEEKNEAGYGKLSSGESFVLPLSGSQNFTVKYFIKNDVDPFDMTNAAMNMDSLRWKIFGNTNSGELRAMGDYIPIWDEAHNSSESPSQFGTSVEIEKVGFTTGKFYDTEVSGVTSEDNLYLEDSFANANNYIFHAAYSISQFLRTHTNNFLVVTFVLNTVSDPDIQLQYNADDYSLYYKVESKNSSGLSCPSVQIMSDGVNGVYKKSLNVVKKLYENSPFTQFVWMQK